MYQNKPTDTAGRPRTTFLIPCYNEAEGVPQLCGRLAPIVESLSREAAIEVLFVDDGSTDGTADIIRKEALGLPFRIITHERNRGIGAALRTGFAASAGDEIVTLDSDCTYDPERVVDLLAALRAGNDLVTGSPYHPRGEVVGVPGWRLLLSKSLSRIYWLILPGKVYTYTSCFRAYSRGALSRISAQSDGFLAVTEFLVTGMLSDLRVAEVPARLSKRQYGQSKIKVVKVSLSHLRYLLSLLGTRTPKHTETLR